MDETPVSFKTSWQTFVRRLDLVLGEQYKENLTVYVDDIIITSETFRDYMIHLDRLFTRLGENSLTFYLKKTAFSGQEVAFLGPVVLAKGVRSLASRLQTINDLSDLKTLNIFDK